MATAAYRFIGLSGGGFHGKMQFTQFGQKFAADKDEAESAIVSDGFLALPEAEWAKAGISDDTLKKEGYRVGNGTATADMMAKVTAAWKAHAEYREANKPKAPAPVVEVPVTPAGVTE